MPAASLALSCAIIEPNPIDASQYDENLRGRSGRVFEDDPTVVYFGPEALKTEGELARTLAHELRHARGYLGSGLNNELAAEASEDALGNYIRGAR